MVPALHSLYRHSLVNWCFDSSSALARLSWSFTRHRLTKSLACSQKSSGYENLTYTMFSFVFSIISWKNGGWPASSSYTITPRLQMSQP